MNETVALINFDISFWKMFQWKWAYNSTGTLWNVDEGPLQVIFVVPISDVEVLVELVGHVQIFIQFPNKVAGSHCNARADEGGLFPFGEMISSVAVGQFADLLDDFFGEVNIVVGIRRGKVGVHVLSPWQVSKLFDNR